MYNDKCNQYNKCTTIAEIFSPKYICICSVDQCKFNTITIFLSYILRRDKKIKLI